MRNVDGQRNSAVSTLVLKLGATSAALAVAVVGASSYEGLTRSTAAPVAAAALDTAPIGTITPCDLPPLTGTSTTISYTMKGGLLTRA